MTAPAADAPLRLTVVSAGLSQPSSTRLLADRLTEAARTALAAAGTGVEVHLLELRDLAVDIAHAMLTGFPAGQLREAVDAVAAADGLIAVTPVFNASSSGLFKSFFDVLDRETLDGTPVLAAATGGSPRHALVLEHALRPMFAYLHAVVAPTAVYAASEDWGSAGGSTSGDGDELHARITRAARELAALMTRTPAPAPPPPAEPPTADAQLAADEAQLTPFADQLAALRRR